MIDAGGKFSGPRKVFFKYSLKRRKGSFPGHRKSGFILHRLHPSKQAQYHL